MRLLDTGDIASGKEFFQAFMFKAFYHGDDIVRFLATMAYRLLMHNTTTMPSMEPGVNPPTARRPTIRRPASP